jgi:hypothetical protein
LGNDAGTRNLRRERRKEAKEKFKKQESVITDKRKMGQRGRVKER